MSISPQDLRYQVRNTTNESKFKVVFLGEQATGKTSIAKRGLSDTFEESYTATIGIDYYTKNVEIDEQTVRLQIWDTAGQEQFRSLSPAYIRSSVFAVVVYSVDSRDSFDKISHWVSMIRQEWPVSQEKKKDIILIGNKSDLAEKRQINIEEGEAKAAEMNCLFLETSAKTGENVNYMFKLVAKSVAKPIEYTYPADEPTTVMLGPTDPHGMQVVKDGQGCTC